MTTDPELKPCPFCGGEARQGGEIFGYQPWTAHSWIECSRCYIRTPVAFAGAPTKAQIAAWNRRT